MSKRKHVRVEAQPVGPDDFAGAELGDTRRTERGLKLARSIAAAPGLSLPELSESRSDLNAAYHFLSNPSFEHQALLEPHVVKTVERVRAIGLALALHDTSAFLYGGTKRRRGLGRVNGSQQGFFAHFALAVTPDEWRRPLGVLGMETWSREDKARRPRRKSKSFKLSEDRESRRWPDLIEAVEQRFSPGTIIHVGDREADTYEVFAALQNRRFVLRVGAAPRRLELIPDGERTLLREGVDSAREVFERAVPISKREWSPLPTTRRIHPPREQRTARLVYSVLRARLVRPQDAPHLKAAPPKLDVNLVYVRERDAPTEEDRVEWILATTEPVETAAEVQRIVDVYRARWLIEEFFKALKSGCAAEDRQLESMDALERCLILTLPTACRMLDLRSLAQMAPRARATEVLSETELEVLRTCANSKLTRNPTVKECLLAVAKWGGHQSNNGDPGWLTLARGMKRLTAAVEVWELAFQAASKRSRG